MNGETGVVHNLMIIRSVLNIEYIVTFQMFSLHFIIERNQKLRIPPKKNKSEIKYTMYPLGKNTA